MKKVISAIIAAAMAVTTLPMMSYASEKADVMEEYNAIVSQYDSGKRFIDGVVLTENSKEATIDGKQIMCSEEVTKVDGTVMVPIDSLCDHITATYEPADEKIGYSRIEYENSVVWFSETTGAINTSINGEDNIEVLDETPYKEDDTVMVPLDSFAEALGYEVTESNEDGNHYLLTQPYQTARLLVSTKKKSINTQGAQVSLRDEANDITVLQYSTAQEAKSAAESIADIKGVTNVEPDGIMSTCMFEGANCGSGDVESITDHRDVAASEAIHIDDMLEPLANEKLSDVTVGIIDTGVCSTHEALKDRIICADKDFSSDGQETSEDNNGHGTHVTGILLDNTLDNVKALAVKALSGEGKGTDYQIYQAMHYAVDQGAKVLNMSLGRYGKSDLLTECVQELWKKNISVVVAAGNSSWFVPEFTPAGIPECITVGACDSDTSWAKTDFANGGYLNDCDAPGWDVYSTWIYDDGNNGYAKCTGTSMSSPFAAAAAAMMYSYDYDYTAEHVHETIKDKAQPSLGGKYYEGNDGTGGIWKHGVLDCRYLIDFNRTAMPKVSVTPDYLTESAYNTITCDDEDAEIYYTTDGSRASKENGTLYTEPILIDKTIRLHVIAYSEGKGQSCQEYYDYVVVVTPDESKFSIDGNGIITDFKYTDEEDKYLRIPNTVKGRTVYGIGDEVFKNNTNIRTIFMPKSCTWVGDYAFYGCSMLKKVNGVGVDTVGNYAFYETGAKTAAGSFIDMKLGELETVGEYSFCRAYGYTALSSTKLIAIAEGAFYQTPLNYLNIPNVVYVGDYAFYNGCRMNMALSLPKAEQVGKYAFSCGIPYIDLPALTDAANLGEGAFSGSALYAADFPNLEGELASKMFYDSAIRTVNMPKITSVGDMAFYKCDALKELVLENVVDFNSTLSATVTVPGVGTSVGSIEKVSMPKCETFNGRIESYYLRSVNLPKCRVIGTIKANNLKYIYLPRLEYFERLTGVNNDRYCINCPNLIYAYLPKLKDICRESKIYGTTSVFLDCFSLERAELPSLLFDRTVSKGSYKKIFALTNSSDKTKCKLKTISAMRLADKEEIRDCSLAFDITADLPTTQSGGELSIEATGYNLSYQWYYSKDNTDFTPVKGAVNPQFSPSDIGYYYVEVTTHNYTNEYTKAKSNDYTVTPTRVSATCQYTAETVINRTSSLNVTAPNEFTVTTNSSTFNATKSGNEYSLSISVPQGYIVTLNYGGSDFEAWVDDKSRTVSAKSEYSFRMADEATIGCITKNKGTVSFYNANGVLIQSRVFSEFRDSYFPESPTLYGHTFIGWDKTAQEIDEAVKSGSSVKVTAQYKRDLVYHGLKINGGKVVKTTSDDYNGEMSFREFSTVTVRADYSSPTFRYWVDGNGAIVSYRREYKFYMVADLELTAVYGDEPAARKPIIRTVSTYYDSENKRSVFISERDIPDEYTVLETGFLISDDNDILNQVQALTLDYTGNYLKSVSVSKGNTGTYIANRPEEHGRHTWGTVSYVIYQTPNGEVKTVYSDYITLRKTVG